MNENWKPVVGYEGLYEISDLGNVRNLTKRIGKNKKQRVGKDGYMTFKLVRKNHIKYAATHREVAKAFLQIADGLVVNHIDSDKTNNRLENLEMVTVRDNINHHHCTKPNKLIGVKPLKNGRFSSQIRLDGQLKYLGVFDTAEQAHTAYKNAAENRGIKVKYLSSKPIKDTQNEK